MNARDLHPIESQPHRWGWRRLSWGPMGFVSMRFALVGSALVGFALTGFALIGCMDYAAKLGMTQAQWSRMGSDERAYWREAHGVLKEARQYPARGMVGPDHPLRLSLESGQAVFEPGGRRLDFRPVHWRMHAGMCRVVTLAGVIEPYRARLRVCYERGVLSLDPSEDRLLGGVEGTLHLYHTLLWRQGFVYRPLSSRGVVGLDQVALRVQEEG